MIDFAQVRYLDLGHDSESLGRWSRLTRGLPAALAEDDEERRLCARLAALMGTARALTAPSTLHAAFDLFATLAAQPVAVYCDEAVYPILRWGAERAVLRGAPLAGFAAHDVGALGRALAAHDRRRRPIVVCDAVCGGCGERAPIAALVELVRAHDGLLVLDDTQGLGLIGTRWGDAGESYGRGGGGSLQHASVRGEPIVVVASLAKAFGAPLTVVAGEADTLAVLERGSLTRVHCSPPSTVAVRAAAHALDVNERRGDALRRRLHERVAGLRQVLRAAGLRPLGGSFPVQSVSAAADVDVRALHRRLRELGVRTVLRRPRCRGVPLVSFVVSAGHEPSDVAAVGWAVRQANGGFSRTRGCA